MSYRLNLILISLLIGGLSLTSCNASQAAFNPTSTVLSCPTSAPQYCPSPAAPAMPEMSGWRWSVTGNAHAIITFDKDDKVSMQTVSVLTGNEGLWIDVVAKDNAYLNYIVWIETLDPGKTVDDLKKLSNPLDPPSWVHLIGGVVTTPMSRVFYGDFEKIKADDGPIYFTLQVEGPIARKFIDHLGPLEFVTP